MLTQEDLHQIKLIVKDTESYLDQRLTQTRRELIDRLDDVVSMIDGDLRPLAYDVAKLKQVVFK